MVLLNLVLETGSIFCEQNYSLPGMDPGGRSVAV